MTEELDALKANDFWEIVVPPEMHTFYTTNGSTRQRPTRTETSSGTKLVWWFVETNKCSEWTTHHVRSGHGLGNGKADPGASETLEGTGAPR
uniref:Uncharacterized protein n=1 Tax=Peronospora matthiolae TaxID=2874970 RepID=A0AAV1T9J2_9STRA